MGLKYMDAVIAKARRNIVILTVIIVLLSLCYSYLLFYIIFWGRMGRWFLLVPHSGVRMPNLMALAANPSSLAATFVWVLVGACMSSRGLAPT
jgi:hypothetical protein